MFTVSVETGRSEARKIRCLHNECGIGRSDDNLVVLQGWTIARRHAVIRATEAGVFIEATGGRAPVKVNGSAVTGPRGPISSTDLIDRKSTRLNSSHVKSSYAVFCSKKKI